MPPGDSIVLFQRVSQKLSRKDLRVFASQLREEVAGGKSFSCLITDDRELLRLNSTFLGKDYPTDVLSFPSEDGDHLGEIAISVERAADQAAEHGHSVEDEIKILMLHGMLHLSGMDHESDRGEMGRAERRWRKTFGLARGLIERARR